MTERKPWAALSVSLLLITGYFVSRVVTGVGFGDAGEFGTAAASYGVTHPPGNPLAVTLARIVDIVAPRGGLAHGLNLLSAIAASVLAVAVGSSTWMLCRSLGFSERHRVYSAVDTLRAGNAQQVPVDTARRG